MVVQGGLEGYFGAGSMAILGYFDDFGGIFDGFIGLVRKLS